MQQYQDQDSQYPREEEEISWLNLFFFIFLGLVLIAVISTVAEVVLIILVLEALRTLHHIIHFVTHHWVYSCILVLCVYLLFFWEDEDN